MAITLPGWLVEAIHYLGYEFPQTNEDVLRQWGDSLRQLSTTIDSSHSDMTDAVAHLSKNNEGPALSEVIAQLRSSDSNLHFLEQFGQGADLAATGVDLCADAVVVLKGVVIAQLILVVPAIAAGPGGFLVKKAVELAIDKGIDAAVGYLLGGE